MRHEREHSLSSPFFLVVFVDRREMINSGIVTGQVTTALIVNKIMMMKTAPSNSNGSS